ncbi:glycosyltransferase family 2 protein [Faecalibacter bovis]|uniref:Glycosyltransferase family 2 protein n=1 Tax=Faecalibacter bovis TaxID=2898187 RepID=A0ABX7XBK9_9FLAO|nr:glycosyltransferase family 2 protein [Faecalibacter bovis]MBS7333773.1 glycosyltransferase family 2 protein [Weeksellaceae bacterium]QTV05199.1 glycosyltransferase family 2 protein [Faecalibacter bovis]
MQKISALLITYNEEKNIKRFLDDADYADEIILVDSYSTDRTIEIAKTYPKVKLFQREFTNFSDQKNFAIQQASYEWITFFDADEHIPASLKEEILNTIKSNTSADAYYVYRKFYFKNKVLNYSGMQNDKAIRVFKKSKNRYKNNRLVHELIQCDGVVSKLRNKLDHYTYSSSEEYRNKLTSYSKLRAQELRMKNLKPNFFHFQVKPAYRFFNHYILRLGFLDGKEGYVISKLHADSVKNRYVFLNKIYEAEASQLINKNA